LPASPRPRASCADASSGEVNAGCAAGSFRAPPPAASGEALRSRGGRCACGGGRFAHEGGGAPPGCQSAWMGVGGGPGLGRGCREVGLPAEDPLLAVAELGPQLATRDVEISLVTASTCWTGLRLGCGRRPRLRPFPPTSRAGRGRGRSAGRQGLDPKARRIASSRVLHVAALARDSRDPALDRSQRLARAGRCPGCKKWEPARGGDRLDEGLVDLDVAREVGLAELGEAWLRLTRRVRRDGDERVERDIERLDRGARGRAKTAPRPRDWSLRRGMSYAGCPPT
jgi:hypothetical protein